MTYDRLDNLQNYSVGSELLLAAGIDSPETPKWKNKYKLIFHPKTFVEEYGELTLDGFRLNEEEFKAYGEQVS